MIADKTAREVCGSLWARRRNVGLFSLATAAICLVAAFFFPAPYVATVSLLPHSGQMPAGLFGEIAGLTGLPFEYASSQENLYGEMLVSDVILDGLMDQTFLAGDGEQPKTFFALAGRHRFGHRGSSSAEARYLFKEHLRRRVISFTRDAATGFMQLSVRLRRNPELCALVANDLADRLDRFNRLEYRSKAAEQREYVERRLAVSESALALAESALTDFLTRNRTYASSPTLFQEYGRLQREVDAQRTVWIELRHQLELARIEENKQLSTLQVLDRAEVPVKRMGPGVALMGFVGLALGPVLAALLLGVSEQVRRMRSPAAQ